MTEEQTVEDISNLMAYISTGNVTQWKTDIGSKINNFINNAVDAYLTNIANKNIASNASIELNKILASGTFSSNPIWVGNDFIFNESGLSVSKQLEIRGNNGQITLRNSLGSVYNIYINQSGLLTTETSTPGGP